MQFCITIRLPCAHLHYACQLSTQCRKCFSPDAFATETGEFLIWNSWDRILSGHTKLSMLVLQCDFALLHICHAVLTLCVTIVHAPPKALIRPLQLQRKLTIYISRESNLIHALPLPLCKNHALAEGICGKSTCRILPAMLRCLLVRREDLAFRSKFELTNCTTNIVLRINSCNNWARLCVKISQRIENNFVVYYTNLHLWLVMNILR